MSDEKNERDSFMYVADRIGGGMISGGLYGVTTGYYMGEIAAMRGFTMAFSGAGLAAMYFTGVEVLRLKRGCDDEINHAISGSLTCGSILPLMSSNRIPMIKAASVGVVAGALFGIAYKYCSGVMYRWGREQWIRHRYHAEYVSRPRVVRQYTGPRIDLPDHLKGIVPPLPDHLNRFSGVGGKTDQLETPSNDSSK